MMYWDGGSEMRRDILFFLQWLQTILLPLLLQLLLS
ncbi:hypothetical protein LINPERPRIM_LOCUS6000 [Linum perenne]